MKTDKLFNILVLGGTLITAPTVNAKQLNESANSQAILEELLNAKPIPSLNAFCFPDGEDTCVINDEGVKVPRAGVICCWGTSCAG